MYRSTIQRGQHRTSTKVSDETRLHEQGSRPIDHLAFVNANKWQRDCLERGSEGYNGFVVLVGLFLVLLVENLWTFDPTAFSSSRTGEVFLALLIAGAGFGLFSIFSITGIKIKLQRLLARDILAIYIYQSRVRKERECSQLIRLTEKWREYKHPEYPPACLTAEWYYGANTSNRWWNPYRPRSLVTFAALAFVTMIATSISALVVMLGDTKGAGWGFWSLIGISSGVFLPILFISISLKRPPGLTPDEENPFDGLE